MCAKTHKYPRIPNGKKEWEGKKLAVGGRIEFGIGIIGSVNRLHMGCMGPCDWLPEVD